MKSFSEEEEEEEKQITSIRVMGKEEVLVEECTTKIYSYLIEGEDIVNTNNLITLSSRKQSQIEQIAPRGEIIFLPESPISLMFNIFNKILKLPFPKEKATLINENIIKENQYMTINSEGYLTALISMKNILIVDLNAKSMNEVTSKEYEVKNDELIISFTWNSIDARKFTICTTKRVYIKSIDDNTNKLQVIKIEGVIKCIYSPNGKFLLLLTEKSIRIFDINFKMIYSKTFLNKNFTNCIFSPNSSFFIVYSLKEIIIFNAFTFDFSSFSNFQGPIADIIINFDSTSIYIFITYNNDLLLYILSNSIKEDYIKLYHSYNTTSLSYIHKFKVRGGIQLLNDIDPEEKITIKSTDNNTRLAVLYTLYDANQKRLVLFQKYSRDSEYFEYFPILSIFNFLGKNITNFDIGFNCLRHYNFLLVNYGNTYLMKTEIGKEPKLNNSE